MKKKLLAQPALKDDISSTISGADSLKEMPLPGDELLSQMIMAEAERRVSGTRSQGVEALTDTLFGIAINRPDCNRILLVIGKESVKQADISLVVRNLEPVMMESFQGMGFGRLLQFTIDGYTEDRRALWDIPEIVSYFKYLQDKQPFFLYWMGKESIPLYCRILTGGSPAKLKKLISEAFFYGNFMCKDILKSKFPDDEARAGELAEDLINLATKRITAALVPS